jgi:hypothetical protein
MANKAIHISKGTFSSLFIYQFSAGGFLACIIRTSAFHSIQSLEQRISIPLNIYASLGTGQWLASSNKELEYNSITAVVQGREGKRSKWTKNTLPIPGNQTVR